MKFFFTILSFLVLWRGAAQAPASRQVDFFGERILLPGTYMPPHVEVPLSETAVLSFLSDQRIDSLQPFLQKLLDYKEKHPLDDWLYYQLVRRVAQSVSPKSEDYYRYTLCKWWFMFRSGFDVKLACADRYLLLYVRCDENIYNVPSRLFNNKQYVCLNYHDYGSIDFQRYRFAAVPTPSPDSAKTFSYKINRLPDFNLSDYVQKSVEFSNGFNEYSFEIKVNLQVKSIFTNYPVVDYDMQFNTPITKVTYESLVNPLKKYVRGLTAKEGIDFLMHFTRYAFLFKPDAEAFGAEKRLSPEQTLLYDYSDCEDRAALFFFLVKEIYNLPMLVLIYPRHVTVAVQFDKPYGNTIEYGGEKYSVCEPSPQKEDLRVGQLLPELKKQTYEVAFAYKPASR